MELTVVLRTEATKFYHPNVIVFHNYRFVCYSTHDERQTYLYFSYGLPNVHDFRLTSNIIQVRFVSDVICAVLHWDYCRNQVIEVHLAKSFPVNIPPNLHIFYSKDTIKIRNLTSVTVSSHILLSGSIQALNFGLRWSVITNCAKL